MLPTAHVPTGVPDSFDDQPLDSIAHRAGREEDSAARAGSLDEMLEEMLARTGGPLTEAEECAADLVLGSDAGAAWAAEIEQRARDANADQARGMSWADVRATIEAKRPR